MAGVQTGSLPVIQEKNRLWPDDGEGRILRERTRMTVRRGRKEDTENGGRVSAGRFFTLGAEGQRGVLGRRFRAVPQKDRETERTP